MRQLMAWLGRHQLGQTVTLYLPCKDASNAPQVPDDCPQFKTFLGTTVIDAKQMPIEDRYIISGFFRYPLFLGRLYSVGIYSVVYYYRIGSFYGIHTDSFEIVPSGDARGAVISTYFYARPEASYIVQGLESGSIIKGRNPTV